MTFIHILKGNKIPRRCCPDTGQRTPNCTLATMTCRARGRTHGHTGRGMESSSEEVPRAQMGNNMKSKEGKTEKGEA